CYVHINTRHIRPWTNCPDARDPKLLRVRVFAPFMTRTGGLHGTHSRIRLQDLRRAPRLARRARAASQEATHGTGLLAEQSKRECVGFGLGPQQTKESVTPSRMACPNGEPFALRCSASLTQSIHRREQATHAAPRTTS